MRFLLLLLLIGSINALPKHPILFSYPIRLIEMIPETGLSVGQDEMACFRSDPMKSQSISILNSFLCLFPFYPSQSCFAIWGSRSLLIRVVGEVEFIVPSSFSSSSSETVSFSGIRLLQLGDGNHEHIHAEHLSLPTHHYHYGSFPQNYVQEIIQVPSEPITVCARSLLSEKNSSFSVTFKNNFLRDKDRSNFHEHFLYHLLMLVTISSIWLLPYLIAFIVFVLAFLHAMKYLLVLLTIGTTIIALTPFMFTKRNRQLTSLYFHYFFRSSQLEEDSKLFLRQQRPVFQAMYFSAILLTFGSAGSYLLYHYFQIDRESRNLLLRLIFAVSLSWCAFFIARSFDRYFRDWGWIVLSLASLNMVKDRMNPQVQDRMMILCLLISLLMVVLAQKSLYYGHSVLHFHPFKKMKKKGSSSHHRLQRNSNSNLDLKEIAPLIHPHVNYQQQQQQQ